MKKTAFVLVALLVAAPAFADSGTGRTPNGDPASGAGRNPLTDQPTSGAGYTLAAWPTPVDPWGPNSGTGRTPNGDPASGAGRTWNPLDGQDVNSGAGRFLAGSSVVDPTWPKPNSGAGRTLVS